MSVPIGPSSFVCWKKAGAGLDVRRVIARAPSAIRRFAPAAEGRWDASIVKNAAGNNMVSPRDRIEGGLFRGPARKGMPVRTRKRVIGHMRCFSRYATWPQLLFDAGRLA